MNKSLAKGIVSIIKEMEYADYICSVKYVIFFVSKILYDIKTSGRDILTQGYTRYRSTPNFYGDEPNVFKEHIKFNLNDKNTEEKIFNLISLSIDKNPMYSPAELYEILLTSREKKVLGQVYTPYELIDKMLSQVFRIKGINKKLKILDPSCGGGYFLAESFRRIKSKLNDVDDKYIIENMLYGIDIDDFSIFLTKMSILFISDSYDVHFNIYNLDFLTDDINIGNFDIIIGNPPYVGHKNTSAEYKKILYEKYTDVFYDKADISYCFFQKSKKLLKYNGILSFITSRYFLEALYADKLREYLKENFSIVSLSDFSGKTTFKNAMVSPAVITLFNLVGNNNQFPYVKYINDKIESFRYDQDKLKSTGWIILKDADEQLFNRINAISNTFIKDICNIKQGIITGLDKAFIVNEEIIKNYNIEENLLRKWIKNSNISKSDIKYNNLYLIYTNLIDDEEKYPNTINYLLQFRDKLSNRRECKNGYRKWYELQWSRIQSDFENPKIIFPYKSKGNNFCYDEKGYFCSADIYFINNLRDNINYEYLLNYLNSNIFEFYFKCIAKKVGNGLYEYYPNKLNNAKIYLPTEKQTQNISDLGKISIELFLKKMFNITDEEVNIIYKYNEKG
ncbi:N-6 DNA methylase [Sedimentibacter hydroxybenzoicus DSM 7310]|uniref:site-specific DNA-methyltransferase (adenine-specific) n=1 Tax=Sedimentibacter hydroxybenzoicus DSM 7310 TaxID=1123245 RepID=A0A974BKC3_SEDHY|nr:N-6 DNA methylase [Sedimentibacter hydroxybenzoicus]NYB74461.1 N-6 DNA methylase [Sedimentibacter hydroxybenzoicus DSM 7310]